MGAWPSQLKCPLAVRAVGFANGSNPVSIVIPCHRLIGADGSLTGYGGGLERKRWLLEHEGVEVSEMGKSPLPEPQQQCRSGSGNGECPHFGT